MKISMSVIYAITTLLCVLPIIWLIIIGKSSAKKNAKLITNALKDEKLSFTKTEQWNKNFLGFDLNKNILIFIKIINEETKLIKIDLNTVKSCQINKKNRDFKKDSTLEPELQSLEIELFFTKKNESVTLNLYNIDDEYTQDSEVERAEIWQTLILQNKLKTITKKAA